MPPLNDLIAGLDDVKCGYVDPRTIRQGIDRHTTVLISGHRGPLVVGREVPIKVNTNIGISNSRQYRSELDKLVTLANLKYRPDLMMDHTIDPGRRDFWREILDIFDGPVGTLPHYTSYRASSGLAAGALLERIEEMLEGGVAFMTLHFTADLDIFEVARRTRAVPVTSRGGGLVIRELLRRPRRDNVFRSCFDRICELFRKHRAAVSVGSTFRPPDIFAMLDQSHSMETKRQLEIVAELQRQDVKVLMEGVGHLTLDNLAPYLELVKNANCPFMPLGPIVTDAAIAFDHVASAIGGAFMAHAGGAHILNSVTREEHTGGIPTTESVIEGLQTARVAAHAVNIVRHPATANLDRLLVQQRGAHVTCVISGGLFEADTQTTRRGCTRCSFECPVVLSTSGTFRSREQVSDAS